MPHPSELQRLERYPQRDIPRWDHVNRRWIYDCGVRNTGAVYYDTRRRSFVDDPSYRGVLYWDPHRAWWVRP